MSIFDNDQNQEQDPWQKLAESRKKNQEGPPQLPLPEIKVPKPWIILLAGLIFWLGSGVFIVHPDEQAAVLRFGKQYKVVGPGLNWHLPYPIEVEEKAKTTEVKRVEVGFRTIDPGPPARYREILSEAQMLTADENILNVQMVVQYRIKDIKDYLFRVQTLEKAVRDVCIASLRSVIGITNIDDALTTGQSEIQQQVLELVQATLDLYKSGIKIELVKLQQVFPPQEVIAAFKDVVSATKDKQKLINKAMGYKEDVLPKARGEAAARVHKAMAYKDERVKHSQGDANRFLAILKEYKQAKKVTRKRMYLETMSEILPDMKKYLMSSKEGGEVLNVLQLKTNNPLK
ncbi:MAG: FtsH protease activity modulator HflK [bacterium]